MNQHNSSSKRKLLAHYQEIVTHKVLAPSSITIAPYVINPYRGCEFNCTYCYAKASKNFTPDRLGIKVNAPEILTRTLSQRNISTVLLGSQCECFTYAETHYKLSQRLLKILNKYGVSYTILTKSHLIHESLPLIKENPLNKIYFTYNFHNDSTRILFEKQAPSLRKRFETIKSIIAHTIPLRLHIGPFFPYFTQLSPIFELFQGLIREFTIELYNPKLGNFFVVQKTISEKFPEYSRKMAQIYADANSYNSFIQTLKHELAHYIQKYSIDLHLVTPSYDSYYDSTLNYE